MENNSNPQEVSLLKNIIALWRYLGKKRQLQFFLLFILMLISVFAEIISISAVLPFLGVLTKPDVVMNAIWLQPIISLLNIHSPNELLFPLTLGFLAAVIFSGGIRLLLLWVNTRLTAILGVQLRSDIYKKVLYQSYEFHTTHNSSELISMVTDKVGYTVNTGIMQLLMLLSALVMTVSIIVTLLLINTLVAVLAFTILGGGYFIIGYWVRKSLKRNGDKRSQSYTQSLKFAQEGLGGIRDIIMDNNQPLFSRLYLKTINDFQQAETKNIFLGGLPKSLLEMLGIMLIVIFAYQLQIDASNQQTAFPVLGALALGAQRLLPALQQIYFSWSMINSSQTVLAEVVAYLSYSLPTNTEQKKLTTILPFNKTITLKNLYFSYLGTEKNVLKDINLSIVKGERVGFIGTTGSGKSTLLDMIMGLLTPNKGQLIIDDTVIDKHNIKNWQANIAHVPQSIFLADTSIAENIAFGVPKEAIDLHQVKQAAEQAQIDTFIEELEQGYQTSIGERGVRLSGGQRQRIGIARALYKKANVIIFDEATSALDSATESCVMQAINDLNKELTVIIIAHRLSTLSVCDTIYRLDEGCIIETGSYEKIQFIDTP